MSDRVEILPMEPHMYAVTITEGAVTTHHRVTLSEDLPYDLGQPDLDEEQLVRESVSFLLKEEKPTELAETISLDDVADAFPDYLDEMRTALST